MIACSSAFQSMMPAADDGLLRIVVTRHGRLVVRGDDAAGIGIDDVDVL
ncbi:hypothetical protein [Rhodoferax sp.]|nr:hypothetical protein [Rhodoferax sp.]MDZ7921168.1 hypothetical protein [Rhodoferax sp.]